MPELPEVETVRRALERRVKGRTITSFTVGKPAFNRPIPNAALRGLRGSRITAVQRRGKYLILKLSTGRDLICHLGMSGSISFDDDDGHVRFSFQAGDLTVKIHDPRRFGRVGCELPELGPEPLSPGFTPETLLKAFRGRKAPVKALLLDQSVVAGVGNIYATEALFTARIRPQRQARSITRDEAALLCREVKAVLRKAVQMGGTTLSDEAFKDPEGRPGRFALKVAVYGRKQGACGHPLKPTPKPIAGRTSLYCPLCQH